MTAQWLTSNAREIVAHYEEERPRNRDADDLLTAARALLAECNDLRSERDQTRAAFAVADTRAAEAVALRERDRAEARRVIGERTTERDEAKAAESEAFAGKELDVFRDVICHAVPAFEVEGQGRKAFASILGRARRLVEDRDEARAALAQVVMAAHALDAAWYQCGGDVGLLSEAVQALRASLPVAPSPMSKLTDFWAKALAKPDGGPPWPWWRDGKPVTEDEADPAAPSVPVCDIGPDARALLDADDGRGTECEWRIVGDRCEVPDGDA